MKLLLTSDGLANENIKKIVLENADKSFKIAIIATDTDTEKSRYFTDHIQNNFLNLGFSNMKIFDLEKLYNKSENIDELDRYNIFYICGGNTFKILHFAKLINLQKSIEKLFERNGLYIGVSAGSMIAGPSIESVMEADPEANDVNLNNFTGFSFVENFIFPHYKKDVHEENILKVEEKYKIKIDRLTDENAIFVNGDKIVFI